MSELQACSAASVDAGWHVVLCARSLDQAKSRLACLGDHARRAIAAAMTEDVVAAVAGAECVRRVTLVTADAHLASIAAGYGAHVVDDPAGGLNKAFEAGRRASRLAGVGTAFMPTDLPCLTSSVLAQALAAATRHEVAVMADQEGTGTTLLTASAGRRVQPQFGAGSFQRHQRAGARAIATDLACCRRDVDTPDDLVAALHLGVGARTRAAIAVRLEQHPPSPAHVGD